MRIELKEKREKKKLGTATLAKKLGISESMVRKVESGVRNASVPLALRWGKLIGIPESKIIACFF